MDILPDMNSPICRNSDIVFRAEGDEALLFNPETGAIRVLNAMGRYLWHLLDGQRSYFDLVDLVVNEYGYVPKRHIEQHIRAFIRGLDKYKLIHFT